MITSQIVLLVFSLTSQPSAMREAIPFPTMELCKQEELRKNTSTTSAKCVER